MARWSVFPEDAEPPKPALKLAEQVEQDGGAVLTVYREPVGDHWQIFCLLPAAKVEATPYQRDPSPTHVKRLLECVKKIDRFVDPIVVMSPEGGRYWTPNGNHRRIVLEKLKAKMVPAILVVEPEVAYQILALNTEKAHNLKEKSLEVIRMYKGLVKEEPDRGEERTPSSSKRLTSSRWASSTSATSASRGAPSRPSCAAWTSS
jgi:ParB family chromosome partitioning protein